MIAVIGVTGTNTSQVSFFDWLDRDLDIDLADDLVLYFPTFPTQGNLQHPLRMLKRIRRYPKILKRRPKSDTQKADESSAIEYETFLRANAHFFDQVQKNIVRIIESGCFILGIGFPAYAPNQCFLQYKYEQRKINRFETICDESWSKKVEDYFRYISIIDGCILNPSLILGNLCKYIFAHGIEITELNERRSVYKTTTDNGIVAVGLSYLCKIGDEPRNPGEFILVPSNPGITANENIDIALRAFHDIDNRAEPPEFIRTIKVAGQDELEREITSKESEVSSIQGVINSKYTVVETKRRCLRLLYSTGPDLEDAVKEAFDELGLKWSEARDIEDEDGFVELQGDTAILEISGTVKNIKDDKLMQCLKWVNKYEHEGEEYKGIFIVNPWRDKELTQRNSAGEIQPRQLKLAKNNNIAILLTTDLFQALMKHRAGELNVKDFAHELAACDGLFQYEF